MEKTKTLVKFSPALLTGKFQKRYKRFFADCLLGESHDTVTAHLPNTGSMKGLINEPVPCLLEPSDNPKRKLAYTLEALKSGNSWVGVNTHRANKLMAKILEEKLAPFGAGQQNFAAEYKHLDSRLDFYLPELNMLVEVKSVTLSLKKGLAQFPDAVTQRGLKHIEDLMKSKKAGYRVALVFMVMRSDCHTFSPAFELDAKYSEALCKAHKNGLEIWAPEIKISSREMAFSGKSLTLDMAA